MTITTTLTIKEKEYKVEADVWPGSSGSRWEPPEPAELNITHFINAYGQEVDYADGSFTEEELEFIDESLWDKVSEYYKDNE